MSDIEKNIIPIIVGVTGHRDLRDEDIPRLKKQVSLIFDELNNNYPDTPLILLSPLTEGADQLAAEVALEKGVRLFVPLSVPVEEYEKGFTNNVFQNKFNQLIKQAEKILILTEWINCEKERENNEGPVNAFEYLGAYCNFAESLSKPFAE
ncbi:MAG: hypothetical protein A4E55_02256 [Pelotomaculum sp. PtaU1.Bin035]|nr:MAG: hypothetical protein A4E55_02256 [Pelotomaculum sp. PtaU1.Bin035]